MDQTHSAAALLESPVAPETLPPQSVQRPEGPASQSRSPRTMKSSTFAVGRFVLHFLEMVIAMGIGMAIFGLVKSKLADQGYTTLLDRTSVDYQVWMNLFMLVPMVLWMRVRECTWAHGLGMGVAMVVPPTCVLILCRLGVTDVIPWFSTSLTGGAMFLGMLGFMLYHREMYTRGYSFGSARRTFKTAELGVRACNT